jgi:formate/nitrite transporter FocA (FNT family)
LGGSESADQLIPEPETIYERTKEEGRRRLARPVLEEVSTAIAAGFDIVAGITVLALLTSDVEHHFGKHFAHVIGSLGFGVGFVFLILGRGELSPRTSSCRSPVSNGTPGESWSSSGRSRPSPTSSAGS